MGNKSMSKEVKSENPDVDIIIPTYNGAAHIPKLLDSIKKQTYRNYNCFVIDDFSKDNTVAIVKENYPWAHLIEQTQNNGPAKNRNIAIGLGNSPYIVIFDDDTYLQDVNWLEKAIRKMENNSRIGQLAAMIISGYDENILLDCGISSSGYIFGGLFHQKFIDQVGGKHLITRLALGACSAGTVLRRDVFEKAGGFDSKYYYPVEDLDLSLRIHLMGYDVIYEPSLITYHFESQAMGKNYQHKNYMHRRNCLLALVENYPLKHIILSLIILFINKIIITPISLKFRKNRKWDKKFLKQEAIDYFKSILFLLKNFKQIYRKRKTFNQIRIKPRKYLLEIY
jgi:N-acetylglucosaminyl-diphospho-decaprenol L-rhamnosyltransferase